MDIKQLKYFVEVAKQKSFTKAAAVLYLSQPSLSKMVKLLEEELEMVLIERSGKTMELTEAGKIVFSYATQILQQMDDLSNSLYDLMHLNKGTVTIGLPPVIGSVYFPSIIAQFKKKFPLISIQLVEYGAKKMEQHIKEGLLDFGVAVLPVDEEAFDVIPFRKDEMGLIVSESNHLANKKNIEIENLINEQFILFTKDFSLHQKMVQLCEQAGFSPVIAYESSQWDFIYEMVSENLGVSVFPQTIYKKMKDSGVKFLYFSQHNIHWDLGIITRKNKYLSHAAKIFIESATGSEHKEKE